jgi:hypothetical protein
VRDSTIQHDDTIDRDAAESPENGAKKHKNQCFVPVT